MREVLTPYLFLSLLVTPGCFTMAGWLAPSGGIDFPDSRVTAEGCFFDVSGNGVEDFAFLKGESGRLEILCYDRDEDGVFEERCRIGDPGIEDVSHLVVLMDSLPHSEVARRYQAGEWGWFHPPQVVVPPFPAMSEVIFTEILGTERMEGTVERYYDREERRIVDGYRARAFGHEHPWQERLDYHLGSYMRVGMSYLRPREWIGGELRGVVQAAERSSKPLTLAYVVTTSALISRFGAEGLDESLDQIEPLCLRLLYESRGALRISIVSDHGHNLTPSTNFRMEPILTSAGFRVASRIEDPERDVVLDIDGLVTYFGAHTERPAAVAEALLPSEEIELAFYPQDERVLLRDRAGTACIEERDGRLRYSPLTRDVLGYGPVQEALALAGRTDEDGFVSDEDWLSWTWDHDWPDAPRRLWDAFHGLVTNTPDVMFSLRDGACAGDPAMDRWIDMQSTHGALNRLSSDAVVLTMTGPLPRPLRSREVMAAIEPSYRAPRSIALRF